MIEGSKLLLTYPETLTLSEDQLNQISKLLDVTFEESFFTHQFDFSNTVNYYLEIPSEWARGGHELVLITLLITASENPDDWKEPLEEFVTHLRNIPSLYKAFYYETSTEDSEIVTKMQELLNVTQNFYKSIPETHSVQRIVKLFMFGLDRAGKTSFSKRAMANLYEKTSPTLWLDVHNFQFQNFQFVCFDLGGQKQFRSFWKNYLHNSEILIFVVDGSRPERFSEAKTELWSILNGANPDLPLLILNNKADLEDHVENDVLLSALGLDSLTRPWQIIQTSAKSGLGVDDALNWISKQLTKP